MDKKKMIYIGSLLILTAIISIASFSYAIWSNKSEQRGKLNIVAGSLNYELVSDDLNNNSITIPANTNKTIEIEITSLNNIESKYELYYTTNNENISIGYSSETIDNPTGTISSRSSKKVTVIIKNRTDTAATITFGCQGGFSDKELVLAQGNSINIQMSACVYDPGDVWDFPYNGTTGADGSIQSFDVPCDGYYKLEVWGAQGGTAYTSYSTGGYGGYSEGSTLLSNADTLYIGVGGTGTANNNSLTSGALGGYNGGGSTGYNPNTAIGQMWTAGGGGATHIALNNNRGTLSSYVDNKDEVLIVSGGGGAGHFHNNYTYHSHGNGGPGGGYVGASGMSYGNYTPGTGGSQIEGGTGQTSGTFGQGGSSSGGGQLGTNMASGGGGGYYGGGSSVYSGAGGGSGYLKSTLINKGMYCYDCTEDLTNDDTFTVKTNGTSVYRDTVNCPNGYSNNPISKCAKAEYGYARITYLGDSTPIGTIWKYKYENKVEEFITPKSGTYKLEVWGAQGGSYNTSYRGGYGGYSYGNVELTEGEILNVVVGSQPLSNTVNGSSSGTTCGTNGGCGAIDGGYNGGGSGYHRRDCVFEGGGGATHIAKKGDGSYDVLSSYANPTTASNYLLLVAGGGGGGAYYSSSRYGIGGDGGSSNGGNGTYGSASNCEGYGYGGTQTSGGSYYILSGHYYQGLNAINVPAAGFGYGSAADAGVGGSGGGAGYYGGRGTSCLGGGGGGSGFVNTSLLVDSTYSTEYSTHEGDGYARITYLGE